MKYLKLKRERKRRKNMWAFEREIIKVLKLDCDIR
jgi:hypothetical protein